MVRELRLIIIILLLSGCASKRIQTNTHDDKKWNKVNYGKLEYWAAHPDKKDESDTVVIGSNVRDKKNIDVFFIHPTTLTGKFVAGYENASLEDQLINDKTDKTAIRFQASIFNESCNVYAPRYRQAHIKMYDEKDSTKLYTTFGKAYEDVRDAFRYYMENYNNGKPFIIASHSQGTTHGKRLIKEEIDGKSIQERMIIAYLVGMPVLKKEFEHIKQCNDSTETNCYVSWRTFNYKYKDDWANKLDSNIAVVNPATWTATSEIVEKKYHKGAILYNLQKIYYAMKESKVEGSGLWIKKPVFPGSIFFNTKNYHVGDFNLFYVDIRNNVKRRIIEYEKTHSIAKESSQ